MKNSFALFASASSAALVLAQPASAQTIPEPGGASPQGDVQTGTGSDQAQSGESQSGTTQSAEPAASAAPSDDGTGDIIVTAQRRSETLQQVPIAVSAFTGEALERQQIENASDLQLSLPNVTFTKTNFTSSSFTIRGIGDLCTGFSCDSATGIHVNDMPLTSTRLFETEYFDLERVEVLRGPQGTLFGRNATSGVVNFITGKPRLDDFSASVSGEVGSFKSRKISGMVNIPLSNGVAGVRLAGYYLKRDGFTKNLFDDNRIDGRDLYAIRGTLRLRPAEGTNIDVIGYRFREDDDRSRIQKQLCATDTTGILGCRPDRIGFETVNGKSTLAATLPSEQFLFAFTKLFVSPAFAPVVDSFNLGLVNLNNPVDQFYGGVENPDDLRTINADFNPRYKAKEDHLMVKLEQELGPQFSLNVTAGYARNSVDSRTDYNLIAGNSLVGNPGIAALSFLGSLPGAAFPAFANVNPFTPAATALAPNGPAGPFCTSEVNLNYTGIFGGFVNRCTPYGTDYDRSQSTSRQYSAEAHLDSNFDGPFNFLLGAIYLDNRFTDSNYYVASYGLDYAAGVVGAIVSAAQRAGGATATPNLFWAPPFFNSEVKDFRLKSYGLFGEAYWDVSDALKVTVGLRYNNDRKRQEARAPLLSWFVPYGFRDANDSPLIADYDADASTPGNQEYAVSKVEFGRLTGRAVVDYQLTRDNLLYASYSRGYKSGGLNPPIDPQFNVSPTFTPETINAFEIGSKNTFLDGALRLNLSGFYYDYKGLQLSRIVARTSVNDNTDATVWGGEAEAVIRPTRDLLFNLTASYLKSKIKGLSLIDPRDPSGGRSDAVIIKDLAGGANCVVTANVGGAAAANFFVNSVNAAVFNSADPLGPATLPGTQPVPGTNTTGAFGLCDVFRAQAGANFNVLDGIEQDLSGNELPQAPNVKLSAGAQYTFRFGDGMTLVPRADVAYTGSFFARSFNRQIDKVDGFTVVNAQVQLNGPEDRWNVRAFVTNLTNNDAITGQFVADASSGLFTNVFTLEPRVFGVGAGVKF
ncbi:MAG TPA: TonB-dependent receptor [Sphingomicrobium sp.]|jgi:outer membrane receptor protein involved in Fe transport|nr:TonB-dependent receptor [Sphingomicrobium sp.]